MMQNRGVPASPSGHSRAEPEEVSALRASVTNALADRVFETLGELEGYTPPETAQDWACVGAAQVIRALCLLLVVPASAIEAPSGVETGNTGSTEGESAVPKADAQPSSGEQS